MLARWTLCGVLALGVVACDGEDPAIDGGLDEDAGESDAGPDETDAGEAGCEGPPGLYIEGSCEITALGVRPYQPRFPLWSDGAEKERFIFIPEGEQIDTQDPDDWVFPVGTRVYKTFAHDGVRLETRLLEKHANDTGPAAWYMRVYAWNEAQDAVTEVTEADEGVRENVLGTEHDIPSGFDCANCHSGSLDVVNSFSAIQLNHDAPGITLQTLADEGKLTTPIAPADAQIPGDEETVEALGYLHANCGNCHRQTPSGECGISSPLQSNACRTGLLLWTDTGLETPEETSTYQTAVAVPTTMFFHPDAPDEMRCRIHPGDPDLSAIHFRMDRRGDNSQMPPIGTEVVHEAGVEILRTWITGLTADPTPCLPDP